MGSADADVVQAAVVAEGDGACLVDAVASDSEVDNDSEFHDVGREHGHQDDPLREPIDVGFLRLALR